MTESERDLAAGAFPLALVLIRKSTRGRMPTEQRDRMHDRAIDGLLRAARAFDPGRGRCFNTLAGAAVRNGLRTAARRYRDRPLRPEPLPPGGDFAAGPEPPAGAEVREAAAAAVARLLPAAGRGQRAALVAYYGIGREPVPLAAHAAAEGVHYATAKTLLHTGRLRMREAARNWGVEFHP